MFKLTTMPDSGRTRWALALYGQPVASGHTDSERAAVNAALAWCDGNGYTPRNVHEVSRSRMAGGSYASYEGTLR